MNVAHALSIFGVVTLAVLIARASGEGSGGQKRVVVIEGNTYTITRLGGGRYRMVTEGASLEFGQDGKFTLSGDSVKLEQMKTDMLKIPADLFS